MSSNQPQQNAVKTDRQLAKELRASAKASQKYWDQLCMECRSRRSDVRRERFKAARRTVVQMMAVAFNATCIMLWCILVGYQTAFAMVAFLVVLATIGGGTFLVFRLYKKYKERLQLAKQTASQPDTSFFDNVVPNDLINWDLEAAFLAK